VQHNVERCRAEGAAACAEKVVLHALQGVWSSMMRLETVLLTPHERIIAGEGLKVNEMLTTCLDKTLSVCSYDSLLVFTKILFFFTNPLFK